MNIVSLSSREPKQNTVSITLSGSSWRAKKEHLREKVPFSVPLLTFGLLAEFVLSNFGRTEKYNFRTRNTPLLVHRLL